MKRDAPLHALLIQLEFSTWQIARPWAYTGNFAFEEALRANGVECFTLPTMGWVPASAPASWLFHARELCAGKHFDQVWVSLVHSQYDPAFLEWLTTVAPVRVGYLMESLHYDREDYALAPNLLNRPARVGQQLQYMTHVLTTDEKDAEEINAGGQVKAIWWPLAVPERAVRRHSLAPNHVAAFYGTPYGVRADWLTHPDLAGLLVRPAPPENATDYPRQFDELHRIVAAFLQSGAPVTETVLLKYVDALRVIRQGIFEHWIAGLRDWAAVVNLPSLGKVYTSRVAEAMAAGVPVLSWEIPDRPRYRALFENGKDILLFDKSRPDQLAAHIRRIQREPDFARHLAENAHDKILRYHTAETRMRKIMDWIAEGMEPDYGEQRSPGITESAPAPAVAQSSSSLGQIAVRGSESSRSARIPVEVATQSGALFIKPGYTARSRPEYFVDQLAGGIWQPDVYPIAAYLGQQLGCSHIIDIGCGNAEKLVALYPQFQIIGIDYGPNMQTCRQRYPFGQWIELNLETISTIPIDPAILGKSIIVCADVIEHLVNPTMLLRTIKSWLDQAPVAIVTTPERDLTHGAAHLGPPPNPCHVREWNLEELRQLLCSENLNVLFFGLTINNNVHRKKENSIALIGNNHITPTGVLLETIEAVAARWLDRPPQPSLSRYPVERTTESAVTRVAPTAEADDVWSEQVVGYVQQADAHFVCGNLAAARDAMSQALAILPDDPQLMLTYGNVVLRLGDVEGARREFVKAATLHPNHGPAHLNLGAVLVMLERREEAESSVKRALEQNPNDPDALKLFGRLCVESGRYEAGVKAYAVALGSNPSDVEALLMLGRCACETGDLETARLMYERVLQIEPGNAGAAERLVAVKGKAAAAGSSSARTSDINRPMVSVIVPTYNRPDTLLDALRSILNQTYQDFEVIVVNDAGCDIENIVRFLDKNGKITCIRHGRNLGLAAARNSGIKVARGKYLAYLDDDDLYYPDHLETLVTFLEQSKCKVAYTDAYRAHQEKRDGRYVVTKRDIPYSFDFDYDRILVHNFVPVLCFIHERACLDAVGLFDESLTTHEDWELWIRLSRRFQFAHIKKVTCEFASRIDGSTMSSSKLADFRRTYAIILERHKASTAEKPHIRAAQERLLQRMRGGTSSTDVATQPTWPEEAIEQVRQAEQHLVQGDSPAAAQALSQALQLVPHDPELIVAHGNVLLRLGDVEGARREFVKATVLAPEYAPAHAHLAAVLLHLGRAEEAEASARRALALNPADTDALQVLARVCLDSGRYAEAVQAYVAILRANPDDLETLLIVGNCYAEAGRPEDAKTFYQRVLRLDPGNAVAAENLAMLNGKELASDRAISTGGKASEREPVPVSIIIPVFNRLDLTRQCLDSIRRNSPGHCYEIVVVDNGSTDGTSDFLRQQQQAGHLRVVVNAENMGFAHACNQGARAALGMDLLFLNNDTEVQPSWLEPLVAVLDADPKVGAVGSKLLFPNGAIQHAGVIMIDDQKGLKGLVPRHIFYREMVDPSKGNQPRTYQALTAACLLMRRSTFEQVEGFDEQYWNGYEDVDLCFKLQERGWLLVYEPRSVVIHYESQGGPERFRRESGNFERLQRVWSDKVMPDFVIRSDGTVVQTGAGRVKAYSPPSPSSRGAVEMSTRRDQPRASIIIVTYNSASTLRTCLDSVLEFTSQPDELIVVDNASSDGTRAILADCGDRVSVLLNTENAGFSRGCNQGIRASSGEYIVLLNPDTVVTSGWLDRLIGHFGPGVGAVGPVSDYAAELQNLGRNLPDGAPRRMGLGEVSNLLSRINRDKGVETKLLIGFCMVLPRKVLDEVGPLDEELFLGNDDLELSWRLRQRGYRLLVATDTFIHHEGQVSFKSEAETKTSRLVQESTDRLYAKLEAHYGPGNVPSPMELWGIDWFKPTTATSKTAQPSSTPTTPLPRKSPPPVPSPPDRVRGRLSEGGGLGRGCEPSAHEVLPEPRLSAPGLTSIIILTLNRLEDTRKCLARIETQTPEPHELIIVDNGSGDGTIEYLRSYMAAHDNVRVIANRTNRGFAAGNDQGLALARGDYLLLLNNDTAVTTGWLQRMLQVFEAHPDVGIVGPMSNYVSGPQLVRDASYKGPEGLEAFATEWAQGHDGQSAEATRVVGFCLLTRKEVITRIGGLDEQFGSGNFEDDDFCIRAFQVGFRARIALDVFIHHTGSQTFKAAKIDYRQSLMRNWELFKAKWGIPADAPYEKGYRFPPQTAQGLGLSIPLPDVGADHRCEDQGRWWQEISERPGRSQPVVTEEAPLSVVIIPNGHGLAPLWPSLVQHTKHPLAITILPSNENGNGTDPAHEVTCPDGWRTSASDLSAVRLFNQLMQSADDDPVILLSSDLILTPGWLKRLLAALKRNSHIAVVGPTSNGGAAPQRIKAEYKGTGKSLRQFALRRAHRYAGEFATMNSPAPFCLLFSRTACRPIGPLREDLDLAASLHDYFARLRQAGRTVAVALDAYVQWKESPLESPSPASLRGSAATEAI